jgi:4-hydroxy-tetrahydrodipicolinate reductase
MSLRVGVLGARGRMGSEACRAIESDEELQLAARIGRGDDLVELTSAGADAAVDFTTPSAAKDNVRFCLDRGIHAVVGTSGLSSADLADIRTWSAEGPANCLVVPNFAVGAVLMMSFAAQAAPYFDAAEIVERHHERKLDAPSGTALRTAAMMSESRRVSGAPERRDQDVAPASRGQAADGVRVHSLRLPGSVAHQEVVLGSEGETLTIRHDSLHRSSFMPGMILAVKSVPVMRGLTVGLEAVLDLGRR